MDQYEHHTRAKPSPTTSNADLMSSAKILAGAAQSAFSHETNKIDKSQVAGAAADFLGAAKHYGKLEEKSFGKYVDKAETYLHQYGHSSSASAAYSTGSGGHGGVSHDGYGQSESGGKKHSSSGSGGGGAGDYIKIAQGFMKKDEDHQGGKKHSSSSSSGGAGEYIKLAQGFLKKDDHDGGHGHGNSGGAGDYIKLAQGFMKKH